MKKIWGKLGKLGGLRTLGGLRVLGTLGKLRTLGGLGVLRTLGKLGTLGELRKQGIPLTIFINSQFSILNSQLKKGSVLLRTEPFVIFVALYLAEACNMLAEARLEVSRLVLVDDVGLCQLVKHFLDARIKLNCFVLVCHSAQFANSIAHGLCIISVVQSSRLCLTDSFQS